MTAKQMNYTLDTTTYSSFQVLFIGKSSIYLSKKQVIASVDIQGDEVTVSFEDGSKRVENIGKSKIKKGPKVMDNRHRNWRRRS